MMSAAATFAMTIADFPRLHSRRRGEWGLFLLEQLLGTVKTDECH